MEEYKERHKKLFEAISEIIISQSLSNISITIGKEGNIPIVTMIDNVSGKTYSPSYIRTMVNFLPQNLVNGNRQ